MATDYKVGDLVWVHGVVSAIDNNDDPYLNIMVRIRPLSSPDTPACHIWKNSEDHVAPREPLEANKKDNKANKPDAQQTKYWNPRYHGLTEL